MKLHIVHAFECTPEQFWISYWDPEFDAELTAHSPIRREPLGDTTEGNIRTLKQRYHSNVELPGAVRTVLGMDKLTWDQEVRMDLTTQQLNWKVIPPLYKDKVKALGTVVVRATPTGCERIIEGDVEVPIPMFGRKIEQGVVDNLKKSEDITAVLRARWLKKRFG